MTTHATGTRTMKHWDEKPFSQVEGGPKLTRATVTTQFNGDVDGEATQVLVMMYQSDTSASYLSLEHVKGRIGDRSGSFVLRHEGTYEDGVAKTTWTVVPDSATGDLKGLRGQGSYVSSHGNEDAPYAFDYSFE